MRPVFNPMDLMRNYLARRIRFTRFAGNLLSIAIGISLGILFVSLLLNPVQSYAAQARLDATTLTLTDSSTAGLPTAREQVASMDHVQPPPTGSFRHGTGSTPADSPDGLPLGKPVDGMVRLPGHVLPALAKATLIAPANSHAEAAQANQPLLLTIVLKRADRVGFERYLKDVYNPRSHNFRHFLNQRELARRFGPTLQAYNEVLLDLATLRGIVKKR